MTVTLVHPGGKRAVSAPRLIEKCALFQTNLQLVGSPYSVKSPVPFGVFEAFLSALDDKAIEITSANFSGLSLLCGEFGFKAFAARLSTFRPGLADIEERIAALEERALARDRDTAGLQAEVARLSAALCSREGRGDAGRVSADVAGVSSGLEALRAETSALKTRLTLALPPPPAGFASLIVADFPALFAEFRGKYFTLLWRGSADGFCPRHFHDCCDGHANTLTLILDDSGNIFGGFTPVEWESREEAFDLPCAKADPSLTSFIFTLKNPHNVPARKFGLKAEKRDEAIYCAAQISRNVEDRSLFGPDFDDITIAGQCKHRHCFRPRGGNTTRRFGATYTNDTGLDGKCFFTGSESFVVKEIEVFELTE